MKFGIKVSISYKRSKLGSGGSSGDTTPPELSNVSSVSLTINMDVSEPATIYMLRNASPTLLTGAAIKAGNEDSWATVEGPNNFEIDDSGWADGTWYLHFAGEDAAANITATGAAVEWVKTTPFTVYNRVLRPAAASSGLRYSFTAGTIFNAITSKGAGYWLGGYAYYDGTDWTGEIMSVCNSASTGSMLLVNGLRASARGTTGTAYGPADLAVPGSVGWYFIIGHFVIKESGDSAPRIVINYWRNADTAAEYTSTASPVIVPTFDRFGFGHRADSTPSDYNSTFETCGLCWGTGNPALMHAWVYNAGTLRDVRDYNFSLDANGCTLQGFWPAGRNSAATFDVADTQLDDFVNDLDTPTLVGTMQWAVLDAPIGD